MLLCQKSPTSCRVDTHEHTHAQRSKLTLINWVPDAIDRGSAKENVKAKMLAIIRTKYLKQDMPGIICTIQANVLQDLDQEEVLERVSKFERDSVDTSGGIAI